MAEYVNNHIHTTYSFSPYSPAQAILKAKENGLATAGIIDHDSMGGVREFIAAGKDEGIAATIGFECRVRMDGTPFYGKWLNNPDQKSVAYVVCHGVPHLYIDAAQAWLTPFRDKRNERNRLMVKKINETILSRIGISIDFDRDVAGKSKCRDGGSITERRISFALAEKFLQYAGKGEGLAELLQFKIGVMLSEKQLQALLNISDPYYEYTLLGILKSGLIESFYIDAGDECPLVEEFLCFTHSIGAIPAYAYLGDVADSVTGDKKAQRFEDSYVDELFRWLKDAGFLAVTYMPTRNTKEQLKKVIRLCSELDLFQISGEDINSPTQEFRCAALALPEYKHLIQSTWALIGHEAASGSDINNGMFSSKTMKDMPGLAERIAFFEQIGRNSINKA
jgi:hypothetical protein